VKNSNAILFAIPALIWGSTFFIIKFQVGLVPPIWSVSYRFVLAGIILLAYCGIRKVDLRFSISSHLRILLQGSLLFGFNYLLVYYAELELTSALIAVAFSGIIFLNMLFGSLFLGRTTEKKVFIGALIGLLGTAILFYEDLSVLTIDDLPVISLITCFSSVVVASLGNITSSANQQKGIPVLQANAFGMLYGGLLMASIGLITNAPLLLPTTFSYVGSLIYLTLFGSIAAFGGYLTLIGRIGPERAAYVLVVLPVIAIGLSIVFEGLLLTPLVGIGILLILSGNYIVLKR
jgi:drug/metabolite transporter (DMT)-like permease